MWRDVYEGQIRADGTPFRIIRDGEQVGEALGYRDSTKKAIFFFHDAGVMARDRLVDSHSQDGLFVTETHPLRDEGVPVCLKVFYDSEVDYERRESTAQVIAMLDDIADAVWTLSDKKMPPEEKQRVRAAVKVLQDALGKMPEGAARELARQSIERLLGS